MINSYPRFNLFLFPILALERDELWNWPIFEHIYVYIIFAYENDSFSIVIDRLYTELLFLYAIFI